MKVVKQLNDVEEVTKRYGIPDSLALSLRPLIAHVERYGGSRKLHLNRLGACPRMETVAKKSYFRADFSFI